jgi:hypothetical protein
MCELALAPGQQDPPFFDRRGMVTLRPHVVATHGAARLLCDCLHNGEHRWPPALASLDVWRESSVADGVNEGEETGK